MFDPSHPVKIPAGGTTAAEAVLVGWRVPAAVAAATVIAFAPSLANDFVDWDDMAVTSNPAYQGLGAAPLRWMLGAQVAGHWMPLTWLTLNLDYLLWGMHPAGFHLTNLLLHTASAVVFYAVALCLLRRTTAFSPATLRLAAMTAALFFAVHPLRAESVAWVSERRDVLSGFLFLLTLLLYLGAASASGNRRRWLLAASLASYLLALTAKAIVMTLPLVLVLLDRYPLGRLGGGWHGWVGRPARPVWAEKIPYACLGLAVGMVAYRAADANDLVTSLEQYPLTSRIAWIAYSLWFYVRKTAAPIGLSPLYELPVRIDPLAPPYLVSALGALGITVAVVMLRRRWPAGLAVFGYYAILLFPVAGAVHQGVQLVADRYSYLSCLGWALLVGAGVGWLRHARARGRVGARIGSLAGAAATAGLVALATMTWQQVQVWKDTDSVWRHAVRVTPDCAICQTNRGVWLTNHGAPLAGLEHLLRAVALRPDWQRVRLMLAAAFVDLGMLSHAVEEYQRLLAQRPDLAVLRTGLAEALLRQGHPREAVGQFRAAIALDPEGTRPRAGLIRTYLALGETRLAEQEHTALRALDPAAAAAVSPPGEAGRLPGGQ